MSHRKPLLAIGLVAVLLVGSISPVTAHSWQTEVEQGDLKLGVSSTPAEPIAGMETEFSGAITDTEAEAGVTGAEAEVHINGPGDVHDHVTVHVPDDDPHFHFAYTFPDEGTYTITVVTEIDGQEYAFEFQRDVGLIPAEATGERMDQIDEDVSELQQSIDELQKQNENLQTQLENHEEATANSGDQAQSSEALPGFGVAAGTASIVGLVAFLAGKRN
ncbi:hypothetical protein [Halosolutus halophilus]|uniref:hypothetical protein n=1 Tax=Halosolutus halophilus TaxID=1552990 RepID=UPI00223523BB|nr:hypothetical protein [Halosolutus halophilus]